MIGFLIAGVFLALAVVTLIFGKKLGVSDFQRYVIAGTLGVLALLIVLFIVFVVLYLDWVFDEIFSFV